jgi:hypothetical protein
MNKDISLIMRRTVLTYTYILFTIFILKLCGLDYFGIDISNPFILWLDKIFNNFILFNIINFILIMIYQHIMTSIIVKEKCYKLTLCSALFTFAFQFGLKKRLMVYSLGAVGELLYLFILVMCYAKINKKNISIKRFIVVMLLSFLFQAISTLTRYRYSIAYITSPSINFIMNIDYLVLMVMAYKLYFMKGDVKLCGVFQVVVGSFLQKLTLLKQQLRNFQINYSKTNKKERFETIIYLILLFIWNMFTLFCVFLVAKLNGTFIECIFILTSFWINKKSFGKPFHLRNAFHCFIISNLAYYCLNRITIPISISMLISIILGILLAWFTSKLVKTNKKPLYRGMSEEELNSKLDRIGAEPIDYKICKLYYVDGYSEVKVATLTFYSVENVKKRKRNVNDKLKELII